MVFNWGNSEGDQANAKALIKPSIKSNLGQKIET